MLFLQGSGEPRLATALFQTLSPRTCAPRDVRDLLFPQTDDAFKRCHPVYAELEAEASGWKSALDTRSRATAWRTCMFCTHCKRRRCKSDKREVLLLAVGNFIRRWRLCRSP
jgi:hypothetical protein